MTRRLVGVAVLVSACVSGAAFAQESTEPRATGLEPVTAQELSWMKRNWPRVHRVHANAMALERANLERAAKGLGLLDLAPAPLGQETLASISEDEVAAAAAAPSGADSVLGAVPAHVDNSTMPSFPPIRSQGSLGSCVCWASTYYQMTHTVGLARGWDAKNDTANLRKFSPKWTYNMVNGGQNAGSSFSANYSLLQRHGSALWGEFPYDANYLAWCLTPDVWKNAISYRTNAVQYVSSVSGAGLAQVKQLLANGYVLVFGTYVNSWQYGTVGNDPSTTEDDAFAGKPICTWMNGTAGAHGMTFVGYDDNVWVDINGNGAVDSGEKGALRVANSWGTSFKEAGFTWLAYDALRATSAVAGGPSVSRLAALMSDQVYHMTVPAAYAPKVLARFTVNAAKRNQLRASLGLADQSASTPGVTWYGSALNLQGGAYAFDGTATACDGTFWLDFTDLVPQGSTAKRYFLGVYDSTAGDPATLKAYSLVDVANGGAEEVSADVPRVADGGAQVWAHADHAFYDGNWPPSAVASATPLEGQAPLLVAFDGRSSSDSDGTVASWSWTFGDGGVATGAQPTHTYLTAGTFVATLTVKDDEGASAVTSVTILVRPDPTKVVSVARLDLSVAASKAGTTATARAYVVDAAGKALAGATVTGAWSGLVTGSKSGVTGALGTVEFVSAKTKKHGTFTFTVTGLSAPGCTYDASRNVVTQASVAW